MTDVQIAPEAAGDIRRIAGDSLSIGRKMVEPRQLAERHLSVTDLAQRFGVPETTVYDWNYKQTGPQYMRIGRHVRYRLADVEAWERRQTVEGSGAGAA